MNPYEEEQPRTRRTRRIIVEYRLPTAIPTDQPALPFEPAQPAQPAQGELTIEARFQQFHAANPHVYKALRSLALAEADRGARRISTKLLFEQLRARGCVTDTAPAEEYRLNNIYTRCYARLLDQEPGLTGRIPMRAIKAE